MNEDELSSDCVFLQNRTGTAKPKKNKFAWSEMTNMLWVEQPVGTGFAQGKVSQFHE